jgi:hypothetical protein
MSPTLRISRQPPPNGTRQLAEQRVNHGIHGIVRTPHRDGLELPTVQRPIHAELPLTTVSKHRTPIAKAKTHKLANQAGSIKGLPTLKPPP